MRHSDRGSRGLHNKKGTPVTAGPGPWAITTRRSTTQKDNGDNAFIMQKNETKHTTPRIPRSSPTLVLIRRFPAYLWESGRDPEFSGSYGRM